MFSERNERKKDRMNQGCCGDLVQKKLEIQLDYFTKWNLSDHSSLFGSCDDLVASVNGFWVHTTVCRNKGLDEDELISGSQGRSF